jgi:hypothetical protein
MVARWPRRRVAEDLAWPGGVRAAGQDLKDNRLHAVLCELVPAASRRRSSQLTLPACSPRSRRRLPSRPRLEPAAALIEDLLRMDGQLGESRKKLDSAVRASGTSLTGLFGVGPVTAATIIGEVRDVSRFKNRDRFAAYNGTAPIEVSSGQRKVHRLGFLTGTIEPGSLDSANFGASNPRFQGQAGEANMASATTLRRVARRIGAEPAQVVLGWFLPPTGLASRSS